METKKRSNFVEPDYQKSKFQLRIYYVNDDLRTTGHQTRYPVMKNTTIPHNVADTEKWQVKKLLFEHLEKLEKCHCITLLRYTGRGAEENLLMCKFRFVEGKYVISFRKDNQKIISIEGITEDGELFPRNTDLLGNQTKYWVDWFDENNNIKEEHEEMFQFIIATRNEFLAELASRETVESY